MKTKKMSLVNIAGRLSREEMKNIIAGYVAPGENCNCNNADDCSATNELCMASCTAVPGYAGHCGCP